MKKLFFILCLSPLLMFAQKSYTVGPKETFFSIGRALNIHPRELAEYNNIPLESGVKVGQVLKIPAVKKMAPLTDAPPAVPTPATTTPAANTASKPSEKPAVTPTPAVKPAITPVVQNTKPPIAAEMVAVYHKVEKKETLFQIAQNAKASIDDIKKWNKLTVDGVNEGSNLIVGYKKRGTEPAVKKEEPKTVTPPVAAPVENKPVEKVSPAVVETETKQQSGVVRNYGGGFFKVAYASQNAGSAPSNNETGIAAVFKSTSGWNDGKYYCLHNTAPAGTIVKITSKSNQKFVYAKVLDVIPDLKQNEGLLIRLSNAAADELGISTDVFDVQLTY